MTVASKIPIITLRKYISPNQRRQTEQLRKAQHEEALKEAEGVTYEPGGF